METQDYMRDAAGNLIAKENIKEIDFARDSLVTELAKKAEALHDALADFKATALGDIEAFVDLSTERYGVKLGGRRGNVSLDSFDGSYRIERSIADRIAFDEGLLAAKALIDECLRAWTEDSNANIRTLVDHAFRVDKKGKLNTAAILGLRRLKIDDARWQNAMDAIAESVKVLDSCTYVRVYRRGPTGKYSIVSLDLAAV